MSFIPVDDFKEQRGLPLAPMIDFLFILLAFFVSLAVSQSSARETGIELAKAKGSGANLTARSQEKIIHIAVLSDGQYRWSTSQRDHPMASASELASELTRQYAKGLLPKDKQQTKVILKIDKKATWEPILQALVAIRSAGFEAKPLYQPEK